MVSVLLSALVEIFSVFCMQDFLSLKFFEAAVTLELGHSEPV